jgi:hypothetical protein
LTPKFSFGGAASPARTRAIAGGCPLIALPTHVGRQKIFLAVIKMTAQLFNTYPSNVTRKINISDRSSTAAPLLKLFLCLADAIEGKEETPK